MNEVIQLRNGERVRPEEFPGDQLDVMHERLDRIQGEGWFERALERLTGAVALRILFALVAGLTVIAGVGAVLHAVRA